MEELKPCPFCDGKAKLIEAEPSGFCVTCIKCQASSKLAFCNGEDSRPIVIEAWNKRVKELS